MQTENLNNNKPYNKYRVVLWACLSVPVMFAFGFALVPLYNLFCEVTGLNGKVDTVAYSLKDAIEVDTTKELDMQFVVIKNDNMAWDFVAQEPTLTLHPGQMHQVRYKAHNPTQNTMTAQIIPSVSPGEAAEYVHKIQCFCFDAQTLDAGQSQEFVVNLFVDPEIPKHIEQITLAYTVFDTTERK